MANRRSPTRNSGAAPDIDLLAAYIIAEDAWYISPVAAFAPAASIGIRPGRRGRVESYREAWHLLL